MQPADKKRSQNNSREQILKQKELMKEPINKFLNEVDSEGKIKFPIAVKMRAYEVAYPDAILKDIRMAQTLYHEILWRKKQSEKYLENWKRDTPVDMRDKHGIIMDKEDCYLGYLSATINIEAGVTSLRSHLIANLLNKCGDHLMTLEQYNDFVLEIQDKLNAKTGLELFPDKIVIPVIE